MAREILQTTKDYLENTTTLHLANLVIIEVPSPIGTSNELLFTDYGIDIEYKGKTYSSGIIKSIGAIKHTHSFSAHTTSIRLTGVPEDIIKPAMDDYSYIGNRVNIFRTIIGIDGQLIPYYADGDAMHLMDGIITEVSAEDTINASGSGSSSVTFKCANEFYDLEKVGGRFTSDKAHRGLVVNDQGVEIPSDSVKRTAYKDDLGFYHADQTINILAKYQTTETRYKMKKKSSYLGLKVDYSLQEYEAQVTREVDLRYNLSGKYIPVVYGVQKVDGIPIFADTKKDDPSLVTVVYALCEGEIDGLLDVWLDDSPVVCFNDEDSTDRVCTGRKHTTGNTLAGIGTTVHGNIYTIDDGNAKTWVRVYHGKANQAADQDMVNMAAAGEFYRQDLEGIGPEYWDSRFKLLDTAYVVVTYELNSERSEVPAFSAEIRGKKVRVYSDETTFIDNSTTLNPAWQQLDYLTSNIYGMGIDTSRIDMDSYITAAALFDIPDESYQASWCPFWSYIGWPDQSNANRQIMQTNVTLKTESSLFKNMQSMLDQTMASLNIVDGRYTVTVEAKKDPVMSITYKDIIGGSVKSSDITVKSKYNSVNASISDPAKGWKDSSVVFFNSVYKDEDNGLAKSLNISFPYISNYYTCRSLCERELKKSRYNRELIITLPYYVPYAPINGPVLFSYDRFDWVDKQFLIRQVSWRQDGKVELTLREYSDDVFINSYQSDQSSTQLPSVSDLVRPPKNLVYDAPDPTSESINVNGVLSWDKSTTNSVEYYTVLVRDTDEYYRIDQDRFSSARLSTEILNLPTGTYIVEVRAVSPSMNKISSPATLNISVDPFKNLNIVTGFRLSNDEGNGTWSSSAPEFTWNTSAEFTSYKLEIVDQYNFTIDSISINSGNTYTWPLSRNKQLYASSYPVPTGYYRSIGARIKGVDANGSESIAWSYIQ